MWHKKKRSLLRTSFGLIALYMTHGLGSAIMITGLNLFLVGIVIFCFVFFVRLYSFRLTKGKRLIIDFSLFFLFSIYFSFVRMHLSYNFAIADLFSFFLILGVLGQPLPLPPVEPVSPPLPSGESAGSNSVSFNNDNEVGGPIPEAESPLNNNGEPPIIVQGVAISPAGQFRLLNAGMEQELVHRIHLLEDRMIDGLPPQLNRGEYEALVKSFLDDSISISIENYTKIIYKEIYERNIMELRGDIVERLKFLFLNEPLETCMQILRDSPFRENEIQKQSLEFLDDLISRFGLSDPRSPVDRAMLESLLGSWSQSLHQQGAHDCRISQDFVKYFKGE